MNYEKCVHIKSHSLQEYMIIQNIQTGIKKHFRLLLHATKWTKFPDQDLACRIALKNKLSSILCPTAVWIVLHDLIFLNYFFFSWVELKYIAFKHTAFTGEVEREKKKKTRGWKKSYLLFIWERQNCFTLPISLAGCFLFHLWKQFL